MLINKKKLAREQLDKTLSRFTELKTIRPAKGWIRAVRQALGMTGVQFAARLGVKPSRVSVLEREETIGGVTLRSMQQAAEALDCTFVYALVPRDSLEATVRQQAERIVRKRLAHTAHSMLLEAQHLSREEEEEYLAEAVEEMVRAMPKRLWDPLDET